MAVLGAHPEDLRRLAAAFTDAVVLLESIARTAGRRLAAAPWDGRDAAVLRRDWERRGRPAVLAAAAAAGAAARALRSQADQQERASAGSHPGPRLGPAPTRTDRSQVAVAVGVELVGASTARSVQVEDRGGRSVVTVARQVGGSVGPSAGAGAWVGADGADVGSAVRGELAAELVAVERRTYVVRPGDVGLLLAQDAADGTARSVPLLLPLAAARSLVGGSLVDHPVRTDSLVALRTGGGATTTLGAVGGAAAVGGTMAVGLGRGPGGGTLLVEYAGGASASLHAGLEQALGRRLPPAVAGEVRLQVAATVHGPDAGRVDLHLETARGGRATRLDARLDGVRPAAARDLAAAAATGDVTAAGAALGSLAADGVTVRPLVGRVTGHDASAGGGATVLVGAQGSGSSTRWRSP